jgi:hypothetical protein
MYTSACKPNSQGKRTTAEKEKNKQQQKKKLEYHEKSLGRLAPPVVVSQASYHPRVAHKYTF